MSAEVADDPVLKRLKTSLEDVYGPRLQRVVLFGSRARGDATAFSDYDIAVFLQNSAGLWKESEHLVEIEMAILDDMGAVVDALPFPAAAYDARTLLMHEVRRDGIDL